MLINTLFKIKLIIWGGGFLALLFYLVNKSFEESFIVFSWETDGQILFVVVLYAFVGAFFKDNGLWVLSILIWSSIIAGFIKNLKSRAR